MRSLVIATITLLLLPGCGVLNHQNATHITQVDLSSGNYIVTDVNKEGVDTGWGLGLSWLFGIPITSPSVNEAMMDLMDGIDALDRSVALINVTRSHEVSNWILFHVVQQRIRADVIEFKNRD
jgi:hypothetical protein